jgi:hypothetical protein
VILARGFLGIEDPEDRPAPSVYGPDEPERERRPPIADDEHVVLLVERDRRFDHDVPHPGATVVREVAMELLHPHLR